MDEFDYKEMMERNQYSAELDEEKIERLELENKRLVEMLNRIVDGDRGVNAMHDACALLNNMGDDR